MGLEISPTSFQLVIANQIARSGADPTSKVRGVSNLWQSSHIAASLL